MSDFNLFQFQGNNATKLTVSAVKIEKSVQGQIDQMSETKRT